MRRREPMTGQLPANLLAYQPDPRWMTAAEWDAGFEAFRVARQRWADRHGIALDELPPYTVGDGPFDPTMV